MRRKDREITDFDKMFDVVKSCDCFRIGLIDDKGAYIVPLNFGAEASGEKFNIYFHGADAGKKMELIKAQPEASFEMDCGHELVPNSTGCSYTYLYRSVMGRGKLTVLDSMEDKMHAFKQIFLHYTDTDEVPMREEAIRATAVVKLEVTEWTCKEHV